MPSGYDIEDLVEAICHKTFFADFTVRSPKYVKECGLSKEMADFVVPFKDTLLVFQVKTQQHQGQTVDRVHLERMSRRIEKAIRQFRVLAEAAQDKGLSYVESTRGIRWPFNLRQYKSIRFLVIFDLLRTDESLPPFPLKIPGSCLCDLPIPLHILTRQEFEIIADECDTVSDFVAFLECREDLQLLGHTHEAADPLDVLALLTYYPHVVQRFLAKQPPPFEIDGLWFKCLSRRETDLARRAAHRTPAYIVDDVLTHLHSCIGRRGRHDAVLMRRLKAPLGSVEAYRMVISRLAAMNRSERQRIGEALLIRMARADRQLVSYGGLIFVKDSLGVLVLASRLPRRDREVFMCGLATTFGSLHKLKEVIAIATNPLECRRRSYDVAHMTEIGPIPRRHKKKARAFFASPQAASYRIFE